MARKKQEVQLQIQVETQEEWEDMLSKEGLTVVDVIQNWSGACRPVQALFRQIRNETGDPLLHFAVAKSETIDSLERYRGKCQPCFLCYAGGVLVAVVRGCNSPLLLKTITEQLAHEHKVLDGQAERKEIYDAVVGGPPELDKDDEEEEAPPKEVTIAVLRPDIVADGRVDEIIEKMKEKGLEILEHQERSLTEEEAKEFYAHSQGEPYYEGLINLMTSGPSHVLVITKDGDGQGVIDEWRELIGPPNVEEAKENAPESIRAVFGKEGFANAVHGSDSNDTAMKELAFFFPQLALPKASKRTLKKASAKIQRTLALIRPEAVKDEKTREALLEKIREAGFSIAMSKEVTISKEQAEEFYKEHKGEDYFEELTECMASGPLLALCLAREDAVNNWRQMLGPAKLEEAREQQPDSLRAQFSIEGMNINQIHGADTLENAEKELDYFFPVQKTLAVIKPDAYDSRDEIMETIKQAGFHIAARKETELTKDIVGELYKDQQDKDYFGDLQEHMTSGPTLFMVLTGRNAVEGWREKMGPTDPTGAPDSLRAKFGKGVLQNALHGASTEAHATEVIQSVFGEVELEPLPDEGSANQVSEQTDEPKSDSKPEVTEDREKTPEAQQTSEDEKPAAEGEASETKAEGEEAAAEGEGEAPAAAAEDAPAEGAGEQAEQSSEQAEQSADQAEQSAEQAKPSADGEKTEESQPTEETKPEEAPAADDAAEKPAEQAAESGDSAEQSAEQSAEPTAEESAPADAEADKPVEEVEAPAETTTEEPKAAEGESAEPAAETAPAAAETAPAAAEEAPAAAEEAPAGEAPAQEESSG